MAMGRAGLVMVVFMAFQACGPDAPTGARSGPVGAEATAKADRGGPDGGPELFGFGSPATPERIAVWDIDVKPDGEGLPAGQGSVLEGEMVYLMQCAVCHGPTGVEGPNDRLVGTAKWEQWPRERSLGNYWPYATTLYDYIRKAMPQMTPGSLSEDEVYAVIAYLLYLNEIVDEDAVMSATTLAAVEMPARDRFVPDNRTDGPTIR